MQRAAMAAIIAFASTREIKYVPCDTQIVPQMFRMAGDSRLEREANSSEGLALQLIVDACSWLKLRSSYFADSPESTSGLLAN